MLIPVLQLLAVPAFAATTMVQQVRLHDDPVARPGRFGHSPAIDGDTMVFGAYNPGWSPAAVVFTRTDGAWELSTRIVASDFSEPVALRIRQGTLTLTELTYGLALPA